MPSPAGRCDINKCHNQNTANQRIDIAYIDLLKPVADNGGSKPVVIINPMKFPSNDSALASHTPIVL